MTPRGNRNVPKEGTSRLGRLCRQVSCAGAALLPRPPPAPDGVGVPPPRRAAAAGHDVQHLELQPPVADEAGHDL